ncbi:hypothetical protein K1719_008523 [Acacia pycnantha]|nr:hypothetical protein K1719_008523 [Acacia pycnantha]
MGLEMVCVGPSNGLGARNNQINLIESNIMCAGPDSSKGQIVVYDSNSNPQVEPSNIHLNGSKSSKTPSNQIKGQRSHVVVQGNISALGNKDKSHQSPSGNLFARSFLPLDLSTPIKATIFMTHGYGFDTGWLFQRSASTTPSGATPSSLLTSSATTDPTASDATSATWRRSPPLHYLSFFKSIGVMSKSIF